MALQTFLLFNSLPESVRNDIWSRATTDIATAPSVRLVKIWRGYTESEHELALVEGAEAAVLHEIGASEFEDLEEDMTKEELDEIRRRQKEIGRNTLRAYYATLVSITPNDVDSALAPYKAAWTLGDLAGASTGALRAVTRRLAAMGKKRRHGADGVDVSAVVDFSKDIVCFRGPQMGSRGYGPPYFEKVRYGTQVARQVVHLPYKPFSTVHIPAEQQRRDLLCNPGPSLIEACPAMASVKRAAFVYRDYGYWHKGTPKYDDLHEHQSLYSLWPYNLPSLREIYLIDESIKLKPGRQQKDVASTPSFAGCHGTFYEVNLPPSHEDVCSDESEEVPWDIRTDDGRVSAVVWIAESVRLYYQDTRNFPEFGPATRINDVKVLAYIPHTPRGPV
jgi:hypothetical protein